MAITHSTDQALTKTKGGTDALAKAGSGMGSKLLVKAARFYGAAGVYLRALLLLAGLVLVFVQKAPQAKPGQGRRNVINRQALRVVAGLCGALFLAAGYTLLNMHRYSPGFIEFGYPGAAVAVLGSGGVVGLLWAMTKKPAFGLSTERRKVKSPDAALPHGGRGLDYRGQPVPGHAGAGRRGRGQDLLDRRAAD
ncbi:hypothetical protein [Hymenobacter sp. 102]|uniref:hypothetical protein n=1 Tax=Hymenobacter sp. 102 TaxID=3403152 RepID=UPI003CF97B0C